MPKNLEATPEATPIDDDTHNLQTDARTMSRRLISGMRPTMLWAGRKIIAAVGVATMAFALICALVFPPYYTATASFIAQSSTPSASSLLASQLGSLGRHVSSRTQKLFDANGGAPLSEAATNTR
jgi:LPS O-antigen subunit length determinant protein (WzzB/FepE family)